MKFILAILALALVMGISVATLENGDLTNIDPVVFDGADFQKDGVSAGSESDMTSSMAAFAKDGNERDAKLAGAKVALVGSLAKAAYFSTKPADLPTTAAQVASYLDEKLNRSDDLIILDNLNVTNNTAEA